jgi:hypothetical protein
MNLDELVDGLGERLKEGIEGLDLNPSVKAYKWGAGGAGLDKVPAAIVQIPRIERTGVLQKEDHVGFRDLRMQFEVVFIFDASNVNYFMPKAIETVSAFIDFVDANPGLNGLAEEAKVTNADPANVEEANSRPRFAYSTTVDLIAFL